MANSNAANVVPSEATMPGLADIQEPLLANDWYLAPGWGLLLLIILTLISFGGYRWWRYYQQQKPRKYALTALASVDLLEANAPEQITTLLKRLIKTKAPAHPALTFSGEAWQQYLLTSLPAKVKLVAPLPDLTTLHYQRSPAIDDVRSYAAFATLWLSQVTLNNNSGAGDV